MLDNTFNFPKVHGSSRINSALYAEARHLIEASFTGHSCSYDLEATAGTRKPSHANGFVTSSKAGVLLFENFNNVIQVTERFMVDLHNGS